MRIDFNIVWVEDQEENVKPQKEAIARKLLEHGFRLREKFVKNHSEATKLLGEDIYRDHVDLVIMDENLADDESGADGLQTVRDLFPYKDIIYYSANSRALGENVAEKGVQGVFWTPRESLVDVVYEVFETLIKKVIDLDHFRGIVLGTTSAVDELVEDFLKSWLQAAADNDRAKIDEYAKKLATEKKEKFDQRMGLVKSDSGAISILDIEYFLESLDKLKLCLKVLKLQDGEEASKAKLNDYIGFIQIRNILAHVSSTSGEGFSRVLRRKDNSEITADEMTRIRKELLAYLDFFENLDSQLPDAGGQ